MPDHPRTACDQCRFRKLKCDTNLPCVRCLKSDLACSYKQKTTRSRRIAILRDREANANSQNIGPTRTTTSTHPRDANAESPNSVSRHRAIGSAEVIDGSGLEYAGEANTATPSAFRLSPPQTSSTSHPDNLHRTDFNHTYLSRYVDTPQILIPVSENTIWPAAISHSDILRWLEVYFDRLYLTLPLVNRATLYQDMMRSRHKEDAEFCSMLLAICALSIVQPVLREEYESLPSRRELATRMLQAALGLRRFDFGENITLEGAIASFFIFATFFGMGMHKSAWLRLQECVECGKLLGLHRPQAYQGLDTEVKGQRYRLLLILSVTERGVALQRNRSISITGQNVNDMKEMYLSIGSQAPSSSHDIYIHDDKEVTAVHGLLQLMKLFDAVDEQVIPCWNRSCAPALQTCQRLTIRQVEKVYHCVAEALESHGSPSWVDKTHSLHNTQWADCFVLQQWLLVRLWVSCLTHDLLDSESSLDFMRPSFVLDIAERVANQCLTLGTDALAIHGNGMIERLHDIAMGAIMAAQGYDQLVDMQRARLTLDAYVQLLRQFRDQGRPFTTALESAQRTIIG